MRTRAGCQRISFARSGQSADRTRWHLRTHPPRSPVLGRLVVDADFADLSAIAFVSRGRLVKDEPHSVGDDVVKLFNELAYATVRDYGDYGH